ncbi:MAG: tetratricopeptide repeat protein, partial [Planctomycetota bacterium]
VEPLRSAVETLAARYPSNPERPRVIANLGLCLLETGHFAEAETFGLEAVVVGRLVFGAESPFVARTIDRFARLYTRVGGEERAASWRDRLPR